MRRKKILGLVQISILIMSLFSGIYSIKSATANEVLDSLNEIRENIETCVETKDGSVCQQFQGGECEIICNGECIKGERDGVAECELGACIDEDEGICSAGATKQNCEEKGGRFVAGEIEEIGECDKHCCILGNEADFVTEKRCEILSKEAGIEMQFDTNIHSADICTMFVKDEEIGACTWPSEGSDKFECEFTTLSDCVNTLGNEASFSKGMLCSNPELRTVCTRQNSTGCVEGLDGVYWIDSCGNRENIFSEDEEESWNDGMVLSLEDSCTIGTSSEPLKNQRECGNCGRLLGSACGPEIAGQEMDDEPDSGFVCKDLGCDDGGVRRENGETWCKYTSNFGPSVDVPFLGAISSFANLPIGNAGLRAMASPGSEHFRKTCIDGEITAEPCGPYRNGICVESRSENEGESFSTAACIPNRWAECLNYNANSDGILGELTNIISQISSIPGIGSVAGKALALPAEAEKVKVMNMMLSCEKDPDCFVKTVSVGKDFSFPTCVPKYPPGFYKKEMDQNDAGICSFANQVCSSVWIKESTPFTFGAATHWECKAGCDCVDGSTPSDAKPNRKFVNEMHALCISLGDCGAKANYIGDIGGLPQGYALKKAEYEGLPKAPDEDRKKQKVGALPVFPTDDSRAIEGKYIDSSKYEKRGSSSSGAFGFGSGEGDSGEEGGIERPGAPNYEPNDQVIGLTAASLASGGLALGLNLAMHNGWSVVASAPTSMPADLSVIRVPTGGLDSSTIGSGLTHAEASAQAAGYEGSLPNVEASVVPTSPQLQAFTSGAIGASIGIAVVSLLVGISGIGRGVGTGGTIAYVAGGGISGAMIGVAYFTEAGGPAWLGPAGIATAVIIVADIIAQWIAGVGEIRTVEVYFECNPWTAPAGAKCEECGKNGLPCNQYNCETLGRECEFVKENEGADGTNETLCVRVSINDVAGPKITETLDDALIEGFEYSEVNGLGSESARFRLEKNNAEEKCISQFEKANFGFKLDEPGECGYSFEEGTDFEEMFSLGGGGLRYEHRASLGNIWEELDANSEDIQELNLYIKCRDYILDEETGGTVGGENVLSFCVNPIDMTAPYIVRTNIPEGYVAANNQSNITLVVTFDEHVSGARADIRDVSFEEMGYEMTCAENVCTLEVPLSLGNNQFYIRAIDEEGNEMGESYPLSIERSDEPLKISSVEGNGQKLDGARIVRGKILNAIEIIVKTEGGVDGTAECAFRTAAFGEAFFDETGIGKTSVHKQTFDKMINGKYNIEVSCTDGADNNAKANAAFTIVADVVPPLITRVYDNSGKLVVITNEAASCYISEVGCIFDETGASIMSGNNLVHEIGFEKDKKYFVKCIDSYGNEPRECGLRVAGGKF